MTCHWIQEFLEFWHSGFLVPGSVGSASHSLFCVFWFSFCPKWYIVIVWNTFYSNCCCFSGSSMILNASFFAPPHSVSTLLNKPDCSLVPFSMLAQSDSTLTAPTAWLCVIQNFCSDESKIKQALLWSLTAEIWFAWNIFVLFPQKNFELQSISYSLKALSLNFHLLFLCNSIKNPSF